jgi:hypothetical protein
MVILIIVKLFSLICGNNLKKFKWRNEYLTNYNYTASQNKKSVMATSVYSTSPTVGHVYYTNQAISQLIYQTILGFFSTNEEAAFNTFFNFH